MSAPLKELERLVKAGTAKDPLLRHGGNPVLRWMADNLRIYSDAAGNIKPDKARSMDKIDGISAMTTAMALAMPAEQTKRRSVYEDRGLELV
jgi:phage terminase large subunit-like protein